MRRSNAPWNRPIYATRGRPGHVVVNYNGKPEERPALRCRHCKAVVALNPDRKRAREHCVACNGYVCDDARCKRCPQAPALQVSA